VLHTTTQTRKTATPEKKLVTLGITCATPALPDRFLHSISVAHPNGRLKCECGTRLMLNAILSEVRAKRQTATGKKLETTPC